ncbi:MAG: NUDIX domain-containing protein [DPANN group archaeon]|nr:NUDIX domain-containing protein [DPANN group archaeon]
MGFITENLCITDQFDKVLYFEDRNITHQTDNYHRGIHIILLNNKDEILLQVRSPSKDKYPNTYDCSVSEHVIENESYLNTAIRGIKEELNIDNPTLKKRLKFKASYGTHDKMIVELFETYYDGKINPDKDEIEKTIYIKKDKIKNMLKTEKEQFAPWTYNILKWYLDLPSNIIEM